MADVERKVPENVDGPYFVDDSCIDCDTCRCVGPEHFTRCEDRGYSYVHQQPRNGDEEEILEEAMECCPANAIGRQISPGAEVRKNV